MTLEDFVAAMRSGAVDVRGGEMDDSGSVITKSGPRPDLDAEGIVAEAFDREVLDSETTTWDEALARVRALLGQ